VKFVAAAQALRWPMLMSYKQQTRAGAQQLAAQYADSSHGPHLSAAVMTAHWRSVSTCENSRQTLLPQLLQQLLRHCCSFSPCLCR
jgi:hypothetical protein